MSNLRPSDSALQQQFLRTLQRLWPAIKGSLVQVNLTANTDLRCFIVTLMRSGS